MITSAKSNSRKLFIFLLFLFFLNIDFSSANSDNKKFIQEDKIKTEYLQSRNELEDYILDTGDVIYLDFFPANELDGLYPIDEEGELFLPRLDETYVRGLTKSELENLLEKRYAEFLIEPEIKVRIAEFKSLRILIQGEVRNPGLYKFPPYISESFKEKNKEELSNNDSFKFNNLSGQAQENVSIKKDSDNITTISYAIRKAGGITSQTDLSKIEIVRDVPIGKGGGKKRAFIDFNSFINESDPSNDIRLFDGDRIFFSKMNEEVKNQIPKSILSGISPRFISVNIFGRVENPGIVRLPLEATLSDAIDLSGPIRPLSGKIVLIRYEKDGTVLKKIISYSARAKRGSKRNPYVKEGDLLSVKNSILGKSTQVIKEITEPFIGVYTTKSVIEDLSN